MSAQSAIEWTDRTWNPVTGCTKVSPGCAHCYAERMSERLRKMGALKYQDSFTPTLHWETLSEPRRWRKPSKIFVCSMSDLFQDHVPDAFIFEVMREMLYSPQHVFQVLTKRAERMYQYFCKPGRMAVFPENCWLGVSVEDQARICRANWLVEIPAGYRGIALGIEPVRFLSVEPMLGPVFGIPAGINWVICGGESGPKARPIDPGWVRNLRDECLEKSIPFFFKQWGGRNKKAAGRELDGRTWDEMPRGYEI